MRRRRSRPRHVAYVLVRREAGQIVDARISPYRELQDRRWEALIEGPPAFAPDIAKSRLWGLLEAYPEVEAIMLARHPERPPSEHDEMVALLLSVAGQPDGGEP